MPVVLWQTQISYGSLRCFLKNKKPVLPKFIYGVHDRFTNAGCRHCPYHHQNVSLEKRAQGRIQTPSLLWGSLENVTNVDVLFWSGGKDSFLALRELTRQQSAKSNPSTGIVLLTTFEVEAPLYPVA